MATSQKLCSVCRQYKSLDQFNKNKRKSDGYDYLCKSCNKIAAQKRQEQYKQQTAPAVSEKLCSRCNTVKPAEQFCKNRCRSDGLDSMCMECKSKYNKERYENNKKKTPDLISTTRVCRVCGEEKSIEGFAKNPVKKNGYENICLVCKNNYVKCKRVQYRFNNNTVGITIESKKCSNCKEIKSITEFNKNICGADGLDHRCKSCCDKIAEEYRKTPKGKIYVAKKAHKRRQLESKNHAKSDITPDQWTLCLEEVNYTCPMCGKAFGPNLRPHIDHIYPLSKGGDLTYWNVQPLCRSCNSSKCDNIRVDHQLRKAQTIANRLYALLI